jgi:hypothetical protein
LTMYQPAAGSLPRTTVQSNQPSSSCQKKDTRWFGFRTGALGGSTEDPNAASRADLADSSRSVAVRNASRIGNRSAAVRAQRHAALSSPLSAVSATSVKDDRSSRSASVHAPKFSSARSWKSASSDLGRTREIQRRFNVSVPRARVTENTSTLRDRSKR